MKRYIASLASAIALLGAQTAWAQNVKPFRIALLNDQSTGYSDASGKGSIVAA